MLGKRWSSRAAALRRWAAVIGGSIRRRVHRAWERAVRGWSGGGGSGVCSGVMGGVGWVAEECLGAWVRHGSRAHGLRGGGGSPRGTSGHTCRKEGASCRRGGQPSAIIHPSAVHPPPHWMHPPGWHPLTHSPPHSHRQNPICHTTLASPLPLSKPQHRQPSPLPSAAPSSLLVALALAVPVRLLVAPLLAPAARWIGGRRCSVQMPL